MIKEKFYIDEVPCLLLGQPSSKVVLYIHGQGGNKEESTFYYDAINQIGYQIMSIDLPKHGELKDTNIDFLPWNVVPLLQKVLSYIKANYSSYYLFANSVGAYFSMLVFKKDDFDKFLFLSPVIDMKALITRMMSWAHVSLEQLQKEKEIETSFGQTLMWDYWVYVNKNTITSWSKDTEILYGENDNLIDISWINDFVEKHNCKLTIMKDGEHYFHTPEQIKFVISWLERCLK